MQGYTVAIHEMIKKKKDYCCIGSGNEYCVSGNNANTICRKKISDLQLGAVTLLSFVFTLLF